MIYEKIINRRTIRKFVQKDIPDQVLIRCVDAARLSPCGANRQPLKYIIVNDNKLLQPVFNTLSWAFYLPNYQPSEKEMPRAYIIILLDEKISSRAGHDAGIAAMTISMVAFDEGVGTCLLGAVNRNELRRILKVPDDLRIILVVALGYASEKHQVDSIEHGDVKYWIDGKGVFHVPKRDFEEIVKWNGYE